VRRTHVWRPRAAGVRVATATAAVTLLLGGVAVALVFASHEAVASNLPFLMFAVSFAAVGVVVARQQPANPIAWLLLGCSLAMTLGTIAPAYAYLDYAQHGGRLPLGAAAVLLSQTGVYAFMPLPLIVLLFPHGQLASGWRWPLRGYLVALLVYVAGTINVALVALSLRLPVNSQGSVVGANHPHGSAAWFGTGQAVVTVYFGFICIAAVGRQVSAYRGAHGELRAQLKWLAAGGSLAFLLLLTSIFWSSAPSLVDNVLLPVALCALPAAIGVGIVRYRLYEIDRVISRTISYALLTALLAGAFLGLVALTTDAFALSGRVGVAASTLGAVALLAPMRRRVQHLVDRRFNRAHYDAEATVAAFAARLRDAVELETIRGELLATVTRAVEPAHVSVWIRR
jgi:hypothetical protein